MHFEQFYLGCLSHASYLIGDGGEAVVVDPQRDVDLYLEYARTHGLTIKWVLETHLHADFVSGHRELADRTGATIVLSKRAGVSFPHRGVEDGDVLEVGNCTITVLETPGHTPEGVSYLVRDTANPATPSRLLTGDTLFVGDVGRPDLVTSKGRTGDEMAGLLYDSLQTKILTLPDATEVWPAHGAGSACGRNIGKELHSTIGDQKRFNPNLAPMTRAEFIRQVTTDLAPAPAYFGFDAEANRTGAIALGDLPAPPALASKDVLDHQAKGAVVLDVRGGSEFCAGHVPGAINVGLDGQFASWAAGIVPPGTPLVLVANEPDEVLEARLRLARVGHENVLGYLDGGLAEWVRQGNAVRSVENVQPGELTGQLGHGLVVFDVRRPGEYAAGHLPGAVNHPLDSLAPNVAEVTPAGPVAVICQGGYRSAIAASLLARVHPGSIYNVLGGTAGWIAAGLPIEKSPLQAAARAGA